MLLQDKIWVGQGDNPCYLLLNQANRHGVITGASGTGKTVTVKLLVEALSQAGVPTFMADVKGDVTGLAQPGEDSESMQKRIVKFGLQDMWSYRGCPCHFWSMAGGTGAPVRLTVSDLGPTLLARILNLTDVQEGVLNIVFRVADSKGYLLLDLKDLRSMLVYVSEHAKEYEMEYGRIAPQSVSTIIRQLIAIEDQGADEFFGEPNIDLRDWFMCDSMGEGYVNILDATRLIQQPKLYAMFLLWMLSELFERLPEVGDPEKPKFVFFFDEAHLLFNDMPKQLTDKVIQVVKLIRSKGVGVYFISQSPGDIPNEVLAQLSNRLQHGLRAYTPAEMKTVRAAADSFRANPKFDSQQAILELGTGEALISFLDEKGRPSMVENAKVLCPQCLMAQASPEVIDHVLSIQTGLQAKYGTAIDRESAYELINAERDAKLQSDALAAERAAFEAEKAAFEKQKAAEAAKADKEAAQAEREAQKLAAQAERDAQRAAERKAEREERAAERAADKAEKAAEKAADKAEKAAEKAAAAEEKKAQAFQKQVSSVAGSLFREAGKQIIRNILGTKK